MASQINPAWPIYGNPTTQSVRDNFEHARDEIDDLEQDLKELEQEVVKKTPGGGINVQEVTAHRVEAHEVEAHEVEAHRIEVQELDARELDLKHLQIHASNAAAHAAGLPIGRVYRDLLGVLHIVH